MSDIDEPMTASDESNSTTARGKLSKWIDNVLVAIGWRYVSHSLMLLLAMFNEMRAAPTLPDSVLALVPYTKWIHDHNYTLWLLAYMPVALMLWRADRQRFVHFLYVGGFVSLVRGFCITLTGLGPVHGADPNAGMDLATALGAWWDLVNPFAALMGDAPNVYLTKDLFFSGHTATTFLLVLYAWGVNSTLRWAALTGHVFVVTIVFLSHLHYTIDVVGAWAITYVIFVVGRRWLDMRRFRSHDVKASAGSDAR